MNEKKSTKATKKTKLMDATDKALGAPIAPGELGKVERKQRRANTSTAPVCEDPRAELRRLVQDHKALTKKATAIVNMTKDKVGRIDGAAIPSRVPDDRKVEMQYVADALKKDAKRLESDMTRTLRKIPVFTHYLSHVFGIGPVVAAYLLAHIDIMTAERVSLAQLLNVDARNITDAQVRDALASGSPLRATKISAVRRFCGLAVINGRLERPTAGVKLGYCGELRTRLYQGFSAMWKNAAKKSAERPNGTTSKYMEVWRGYKERMLHSERYNAGTNQLASGRAGLSECGNTVASDVGGANAGRDERTSPPSGLTHRKGARAIIHATGWHKGADVLIEDLYIVWRALEGLPVWPSYYAAKLGYNHGGSIAVNAPKMLTPDEALATIGDVGPRPAVVPVEDVEMPDDLDDGEDEAA